MSGDDFASGDGGLEARLQQVLVDAWTRRIVDSLSQRSGGGSGNGLQRSGVPSPSSSGAAANAAGRSLPSSPAGSTAAALGAAPRLPHAAHPSRLPLTGSAGESPPAAALPASREWGPSSGGAPLPPSRLLRSGGSAAAAGAAGAGGAQGQPLQGGAPALPAQQWQAEGPAAGSSSEGPAAPAAAPASSSQLSATLQCLWVQAQQSKAQRRWEEQRQRQQRRREQRNGAQAGSQRRAESSSSGAGAEGGALQPQAGGAAAAAQDPQRLAAAALAATLLQEKERQRQREEGGGGGAGGGGEEQVASAAAPQAPPQRNGTPAAEGAGASSSVRVAQQEPCRPDSAAAPLTPGPAAAPLPGPAAVMGELYEGLFHPLFSEDAGQRAAVAEPPLAFGDDDFAAGLEQLEGAFEELAGLLPVPPGEEGVGGAEEAPAEAGGRAGAEAGGAEKGAWGLADEELVAAAQWRDDGASGAEEFQSPASNGDALLASSAPSGSAPPLSTSPGAPPGPPSLRKRRLSAAGNGACSPPAASGAPSSKRSHASPPASAAPLPGSAAAAAAGGPAAEQEAARWARERLADPIGVLVQLAEALAGHRAEEALRLFAALREVASVYGDAAQRLSAYFLEGLQERLAEEGAGEAGLAGSAGERSLLAGQGVSFDEPENGAEACAVEEAALEALRRANAQEQAQQAAGGREEGAAGGVPTQLAPALRYDSSVLAKFPPVCRRHVMAAFQSLMSSTPIVSFGQVCANCSILEAVVSRPAIHIVDIGTGHGLHLLPLIRALAVRPPSAGGPPRLHLTLADLRTTQLNRAYCLLETAERLKEEAAAWSLPSLVIDVIPAPGSFALLSARQLRLLPGEAIVVNLALRLGQHLTDDGLDPPLATPDALIAPRAAIAQLVADLRPLLCTVVDLTPPNLAQASCRTLDSGSGSGSTARPTASFFFLSRFYEALHYYAGLFDALEESVGFGQSAERHTLEREVLGRAIVSTIASQGHLPAASQGAAEEPCGKLDQRQRGTWGTWLSKAGLQPVVVSSNVIAVSAQLLAAYRPGYALREEGSMLHLTWKGRDLLSSSAWK